MKQLSIQTKVIAGFTILSIITVIFIGLYLKTINERNEYRLVSEETMKYNGELIRKIKTLTEELVQDKEPNISTSEITEKVSKLKMIIVLLDYKVSLYEDLCESYKRKIAILEELYEK